VRSDSRRYGKTEKNYRQGLLRHAAELTLRFPGFRLVPWHAGNRLAIGINIVGGRRRTARTGTAGLKQHHGQQNKDQAKADHVLS